MMDRYKLQYDFREGVLKDAQMVAGSRGDWVKYKDIAEALNIVGDLACFNKCKKGMCGGIQFSVINSCIEKARIFKEGL